jgi:hypothetical protein
VQTSGDDSTPELSAAALLRADELKSLRKEKRRRKSDRMAEVRADLRFMLDANYQAGGGGVYSGFRLVRTRVDPSPAEEPYVGAFLPLDVAQVYPELLAFDGLTYEDVYSNEELPRGMPVVIGPDHFKIHGESWIASLRRSRTQLCVVAALFACAAIGLAFWLRR